MALNLVRNSKVFFTTNVDQNTGVISNSGFNPGNTFEIQVLDGMSFSQTTSNETVSVSEAGSTPIRGTRSFNTQIAAADFSFSTYLRPEYLSSTPVCEESVLWNAFAGDQTPFIYPVTSISGTVNTAATTSTVTVTSTAGLAPGMTVTKTSGAGAFGTTAYISSVDSTTQITVIGGTAHTAGAIVFGAQFVIAGTSLTGAYSAGGQVTIGGTGITVGGTVTNYLKPNMICYLPNPFSAITLNSVAATTNQLSGFSGLVRVVSASSTSVVFEYLNKPSTYPGTSVSLNATIPFSIANAIVPIGFSGTSYVNSTNTFTITAATNYLQFVVGVHYIFKGLSGTNGATFNDIPAKCTASGSGSVTFVFATSPADSADRLTATIGTTDFYAVKTSWVPSSGTGVNSYMSLMNSNKNQLIKCGFLFLVDQVTYALDNAVLTQVSIDFGIDAIATAAWSGQAIALRQFSTNLVTQTVSASASALQGTLGSETSSPYDATSTTYSQFFTPKNTAAEFLTNKLSTCTLTSKKDLYDAGGTKIISANDTYTVPLTGGNITLSNNVTYLTPAVLAVVNQPIQYYTGNRQISGSMTAYLKTGITRGTSGNATGNLLNDFLKVAAATVEPYFGISLAINGSGQANKVVLDMPNATIGIPAVDVQQVVSTTINFGGQGTTGATTPVYDIEGINDVYIRYYAA